MLKTRVIPTLLWKDHGLVKGVGFDSSRRVGTVLPSIKVYTMRDVDEIILVDISATLEGAAPDFENIRDFTSECFVPITIGGGVRSLDDINRLLRAGADKVCLNSIFFSSPSLVTQAAEQFGSQCVVVSLDARREGHGYRCYSHSGTSRTEMDLISAARRAEEAGAGELLVTSIELDGTMRGYDLDMVEKVARAVKIPVIASGGAGRLDDFPAAMSAGASAVAAASVFHFTQITPHEIKAALRDRGYPVRR